MVGITLSHHATMKDMRFGKIAKGGRNIEITLNYERKEEECARHDRFTSVRKCAHGYRWKGCGSNGKSLKAPR